MRTNSILRSSTTTRTRYCYVQYDVVRVHRISMYVDEATPVTYTNERVQLAPRAAVQQCSSEKASNGPAFKACYANLREKSRGQLVRR